MGEWGIILGATFGSVLLLTPVVRKIAILLGAIDVPGRRKVHTEPMPRMGGVAVFLGFAAAVILTQHLGRAEIGLLAGGTVIVITGIADDIWDLPPKVKLAAQFVAAAFLILCGVTVEFVSYPLGGMVYLQKLSVPLTFLWIIGVTNALNLIDGLDGLAAGTAAVAAATMAVVAWLGGQTAVAGLALIFCAAILGFLPYNFYPAKVFMGDSGSMLLGFTLGALAVEGLTKGTAYISVFLPVVILGIPIFDTLLAVVRRFKNNRPIFEADRGHLHHRLLEKGLSHRQAVVAIYAVNVFLGVSAIVLNILSTEQSVVALILLVTVFFAGAERIGVLRQKRVEQQASGHDSSAAKDFHGNF